MNSWRRSCRAPPRWACARPGWIPLRLPHEVAPLFREWLSVHFPERGDKVMSIVRSIRGGRDNDPDF